MIKIKNISDDKYIGYKISSEKKLNKLTHKIIHAILYMLVGHRYEHRKDKLCVILYDDYQVEYYYSRFSIS